MRSRKTVLKKKSENKSKIEAWWLPEWMYVPKEVAGIRSPGTGVTDCFELPCWCWECNPVLCKNSKCS